MADFITTSTTKSATRELRNKIATLAGFDSIISAIIATNPWNCSPYQYMGESQPPVSISKEQYTAKIQYQNSVGKVIGSVTVQAPTQAGLTSAVGIVQGDLDLETAIGGIAAQDPTTDKYSCTLRCNAATGDLYYVTFSRDKIRVTSYKQDSILDDLEAWADSIPALD
ncbi:MAG: hypothetical protein LBV40_02720 [Methanomicrobiales archaeon]|nr:hypothetical protein [Methanomicrobiales archaeon]